MMHYNGAVVTIKDLSSKKAIREYSHSRCGNRSEVTAYLPFGSEYSIHYKLTDTARRRMELWIDGAMVTNNLIISGEGDLERFVESQKRFKFVEATGDGVADPTSKENGVITVKLYREISNPTPAPPIMREDSFNPNASYSWRKEKGFDHNMFVGQSNTQYDMSSARLTASSCTFPGSELTTLCCYTEPSSRSVIRGIKSDVGATVEGSHSSQTFGTTSWNGDLGAPSEIFTFKLKGQVQQEELTTIKCPYCSTHNKADAKFCSECGVKFAK